jgi:HNH endonuclease
MTAKIKIFGLTADPMIHRPEFNISKQSFENGIKQGFYERIDRASGRRTTTITPHSEVASSLEEPPIPDLLCSGVCEICGFSRLIERAHIVPARFGGPKIPDNILRLCPNHHTLYDRNLLTHEEFCKIWPQVCTGLKAEYNGVEFEEWRSALCNRHGVRFKAS